MKQVEVAAALFSDGGQIMLCRRARDKARGGLWELPGGKLEAGEDGAQALRRECGEELDVLPEIGALVAETTFSYPELTVHLMVYAARLGGQAPRLVEHSALCWCTIAQALEMELCPADRVILTRLPEGGHAGRDRAEKTE